MTEEFHSIRDEIVNKLQAGFQPLSLDVTDDSDSHIGHAGHNGKGETHFRVEIVAEAFRGKSRIERHQMVYSALNTLIPPIHALQIKANAF